MNRDELRNDVRAQYPDENWDTECAGFAYLVCRLSGTVRRAYASATDARNASQIVSTDMAAAPAGAFHHWSYRARLNGVYKDWGHVAAALGGGRAVMTNPEHDEWDWGICLGETDVAAWTARRRGIVTYQGWSYTYGENTANITTDSTAGGDARPFTPAAPAAQKRELTMTEALIVEATSNNLVIVNVKDRTLINLGNDPDDQLRAYFADNYPHKFMSSEEWTAKFGPGTGYNYVGHGTRAS